MRGDQPHSVGGEMDLALVRRFADGRLRRRRRLRGPWRLRGIGLRVACWIVSTSASRSISLVRFAKNPHPGNVADIAVVVAAEIERQHIAFRAIPDPTARGCGSIRLRSGNSQR